MGAQTTAVLGAVDINSHDDPPNMASRDASAITWRRGTVCEQSAPDRVKEESNCLLSGIDVRCASRTTGLPRETASAIAGSTGMVRRSAL